MLAAGALTGCTLIDQRTFDADAGKRPNVPSPPAPAVAAAPEPGRPALLVIRLPTTADARGEIARAVTAARRRKPGVTFDVVEITGDAGAAAGADAAEVATLITAQGVPPARVRLAARPAPGAAREVRVYVQ